MIAQCRDAHEKQFARGFLKGAASLKVAPGEKSANAPAAYGDKWGITGVSDLPFDFIPICALLVCLICDTNL